jgi:hygromycin-B 4-O-kinase
MNKPTINNQQAQSFLSQRNSDTSKLELIGAGAWSQCFGFQQGSEELVIRFGNHVDDFQKDKRAYGFAHPDLPIPKVLEIGRAFEGYYAISTRVYGVPLENSNSKEWLAVIPSLVSAFEAMRLAEVSDTSGFGSWGSEGKATCTSWSEHLLAVQNDAPQQRTHGWKEKLFAFPEGDEAFKWGMELLERVASDSVPRNLVHCDLINRNVFVSDGKISGVFDWGCSLYGDHLYDLAWLEFWSPWTPELDIAYFRSELERQWSKVGYIPKDKDSRLLTCYLHIGLDHLGYNAYLGNWDTLMATARRMQTLAETYDNYLL